MSRKPLIVDPGKGEALPGCLHCEISEMVGLYSQHHERRCLVKNVAQVLIELIASERDPEARAELIERTREFMDREIPETVAEYHAAGRFDDRTHQA
jgi:hypothetical protein